MIYYVIPAREKSKGFPNKNRNLFPFVIDFIKEKKESVIVSTDDKFIVEMLCKYDVKIHHRSENVSLDMSSTKDLLLEISKDFKMKLEDEIVLMYLTYPERTSKDVFEIYDFFKKNNAISLLCAEKPKQHPYRAFYSLKNNKGKKVVDNDLYRRQDYPECFIASHFLAIMKVECLPFLDKNLYHPQTIFYELKKNPLDVDSEEDFKKI